MKKHLFFILMIITMPVLIFPVTEQGVKIKNLSMEPLPFNERRDPVKDSPYNAFDGDKKTSALYSDFTIEFDRDVKIDQIKVINGDTSGKENFKKSNRMRDIEVTLYTAGLKGEQPVKKKRVSKKKPSVKVDKQKKSDKDDKKQKSAPEQKDEKRNNDDREQKKSGSGETVVNNYSQKDIVFCINDNQEIGLSSRQDVTVHESLILTKSDNIIEITDSKKDQKNVDEKKPAEESSKNAEDKKSDASTKNEIKDNKSETAAKKKTGDKTKKKKSVKKSNKKKQKKSEAKKSSAEKKSQKDKKVKDTDNKTDKVISKPEDKQKKVDAHVSEKNDSDKDKVKKEIKPEKKEESKVESPKKDDSKTGEDKVKPAAVIKEDKISVKKMSGIVKVEEKGDGMVLVYAALKDSADVQSIGLKTSYSVKKISFRTRDDEYYNGSERDRSVVSEIEFFNKGKRIALGGVDELKKSYIERYSRALNESIADGTFVMYQNNEMVLRVLFKKDGSIEYHDRFKCRKSGDSDCTDLLMPDAWRVSDNRLYFRYHTIWRIWRYDLDCRGDFTSAGGDEYSPSRWMRLYFKTDKGFTGDYLDLKRSDNNIWAN